MQTGSCLCNISFFFFKMEALIVAQMKIDANISMSENQSISLEVVSIPLKYYLFLRTVSNQIGIQHE